MIISKQDIHDNGGITVNKPALKRVDNLTHLGSKINEIWETSMEIKIRIKRARATILKQKEIFCYQELNLHLKLMMIRCSVFPALLYGAESWTLTEATLTRET